MSDELLQYDNEEYSPNDTNDTAQLITGDLQVTVTSEDAMPSNVGGTTPYEQVGDVSPMNSPNVTSYSTPSIEEDPLTAGDLDAEDALKLDEHIQVAKMSVGSQASDLQVDIQKQTEKLQTDIETTDKNLKVSIDTIEDEIAKVDHENEIIQQTISNIEEKSVSASPAPSEEREASEEKLEVQELEMDITEHCMKQSLVFGGYFSECERVKLPEYPHALPAGLEGLKRRLYDSNGLNLEGIFRLRGKESKIKAAKASLSGGGTVADVVATPIEIAQLIKAWFRDLKCDDPGYVSKQLLDSKTEEQIIQAFEDLTEPRRSILLWTFDLWIEVEKHKPKNKMTLQSMSIVFSPNLVQSNDPSNPMIFLQYQKEAQRVLEQAALLRKEGKLNPSNTTETVPLVSQQSKKQEVPVSYVRNISTRTNSTSQRLGSLFKKCTIL